MWTWDPVDIRLIKGIVISGTTVAFQHGNYLLFVKTSPETKWVIFVVLPSGLSKLGEVFVGGALASDSTLPSLCKDACEWAERSIRLLMNHHRPAKIAAAQKRGSGRNQGVDRISMLEID